VNPILFKLGPLTIHSYGFMMALGVALGLWFIYRQAKKQGLDAPRLLDAAFYIMIVALVGAKLILFVGNAGYYFKNPKELMWVARTGGVFQGGLAFGVLFALWYFRRHKMPTWKIADLVVPALALGHGFGRIGCFLAGCCYGTECALPWKTTFTSEYAHNLTGIPLGTPLHPVQLYEAALNFLNALILFLILKKKRFDGQIFSFYILNYSIIRYITEFFRGDHADRVFLLRGPSPFLSVTYPQLFCLIGLGASFVMLKIFAKRARV
jgi:phosphatidylglycerol:prolipoprotein diacylglycerol transferase